MIQKIFSKGMKGLDFSQPLSRLNLFISPNGSGKSSRTEAATLAVNGYIPGGPRKNESILDAYGSNNSLAVGVEIDGKTFSRVFKRSSSGKVSQEYRINKSKAARDYWIQQMAEAGLPRILDLSLFTDLSDQKKIETIFYLFPPAGDVDTLSEQIESLTEEANGLQTSMKASEKALQKITAGRAELELPPGTLAEITGEISKREAEIKEVRAQIQEVREEGVRKEAQEKATAEAEAKAKRDAEEKERQKERRAKIDQEREKAATTEREKDIKKAESNLKRRAEREGVTIQPDPAASIKSIIKAIRDTGCPVCAQGAGVLIAKRELSKYCSQEMKFSGKETTNGYSDTRTADAGIKF